MTGAVMTLVRSALFTLYFWLLTAAMTIGYLPFLFFGPRRIIIRGMYHWAGLTMAGLKHIARIRIVVRGREFLPLGGALIAAKHMSAWETIMFHRLLDDPALVMKRELLAIPLYGHYARRARMIVVDRAGHAKTLRRMIADAKAALVDHRQIVIFPEGTRRAPGAPADYKPGVAALYTQLGVPCVPVAHNSGLYWRPNFVRRAGTITLEVLPPLPAGLGREAFMERLEAQIETATARLLAEGSSPTRPAPHLVENSSISYSDQ